jgi:small basic protein (TIGR04137 family)
MTIHSSLRGVNTLKGERSVLTRIERIQKLAKDGKVDTEKGSVWGLPKVRTHFKVAGAKKAPKAAEGAAAEGEAAPAAAPGKAEAKGKPEAKAEAKPKGKGKGKE